MNRITRISILLIAAMLLTSVVPTLAAGAPSITVSPVWRPGVQLNSVDANTNGVFDDDGDGMYEPGGDDEDVRFVTAEIWATVAYTEFWAAQITCTVNPKLLEGYVQDTTADTDTWQDDREMVQAGPNWYWDQGSAVVVEPYNPVTGSQVVTISKLGSSQSVGNRGGESAILLATIQYRVKAGATAVGTSPLTCKADFLDRDGKKVTAAYKVLAPPVLQVLSGYTLAGKVVYQARAVNNITVYCEHDSGNPNYTVITATTGLFSIKTRSLGYYQCFFHGNINNPDANPLTEEPDMYLRALVSAQVQDSGYTFLPVELAGGNTDSSGNVGEQTIDIADLDVITAPANWNKPGTKFTGDVNGDLKTDKADLSILAGNWGQEEFQYEGLNHWLFGLHLNGVGDNWDDYNVWMTDRLWKGELDMWVTSGVKSNQGDYWPTLSPDGSKIAFIREEMITRKEGTNTWTETHYGLWVVNADGKTGLKRLTPAYSQFQQDALAPSWSPDGTRIAFVCSWGDWGDWNGGGYNRRPSGYPADEGYICTVDADGRNLLRIDWARSRIFPPAWLSTDQVVFGGSYHDDNGVEDGTCRGTICMVDLNGSYVRPFDYDGQYPSFASHIPYPGSSSMDGFADMPLIVDGNLVYRYAPADQLFQVGGLTSGSDVWRSDVYTLNFAEIDNDCLGPGPLCDHVKAYNAHPAGDVGTKPAFLHTNVTYDNGGTYEPVSTFVQYVEVSPPHRGIGIIFSADTCGNVFTNIWGVQNGDPGEYSFNSGVAGGEYPEWGNPNDQTWIHNSGCGAWYEDFMYDALHFTVDWTY